MGGRSEEEISKAYIMRVDYDVNRVMWRRYFYSAGMDTV